MSSGNKVAPTRDSLTVVGMCENDCGRPWAKVRGTGLDRMKLCVPCDALLSGRTPPLVAPPPPKPAPVVDHHVERLVVATVPPVEPPKPDRRTKQQPKTPQAITRFLAHVLANPGQNAEEITAATGFSRATVNWCACELRRKGKLAPAVKYGRYAYGRYYPAGYDVPTHAHPGTVMSRVLKAVVENPGITQAEIKRLVAVGNSVPTAVWHLRCAGLLDPIAAPYARRLYAAGCTPKDNPMDNLKQPASKV